MSCHSIPVEVPLVVFEDGGGAFGPLVDLRPACMLRAGIGTILEGIERHAGRTATRIVGADETAAIVRESGPAPESGLPSAGSVLLVNGRLLDASVLASIAWRQGTVVVDERGALVAAWVGVDRAQSVLGSVPGDAERVGATLASAPWDIASAIPATLESEVASNTGAVASAERRQLRPDEGRSFGSHAIHIDPSATIGPMVVIDASKGPVVIGSGAVVRPFAVLVGPCAVLDHTIVSERALIKASTVLGPHCRVGGEVGGTIFQGYSNKSHDGHLGDSFVGEWVNIGAGTDNSNLLNTYGEVVVRLETEGSLIRTGRRFWGSVIGDHAKLAIGTRLMTGTTIGTGAMIAQSTPPSSIVGRFAWLTDAGERLFRLERFLETAAAMMERRGKAPGPALSAAFRALHAKASEAR